MQNTGPDLARARVYGIIAWAFAYPEDEVIEGIRSSVGELKDALTAIGADPETIEKGMAFATASAGASTKAVQSDYNQLFVGRQQCSLDESEYDKAIFYRYQRMADIAGFYRAFGLENSTDSYQRPDYVGTELEFMHLLLLKHAYAIEQEWDEESQICEEAEGKFVHEHLEWWVPSMCEKLRGASSCAFYMSLSNFLESFTMNEASRYLQPA